MSSGNLQERLASARRALEAVDQAHVLHYFDTLDDAGREDLLGQVEGIDWPEVARLAESHVRNKPPFELPKNVEPAPWYPNTPTKELAPLYANARQVGEQLIRLGKVAAFTVAGGQGTRLGWDAPKGTFPATPVRGLPLFACFAEYLHKTQEKYRCTVPWYVMTSPINDAATRAFFEEHHYFGLSPRNVMLFPQQMMPAFDMCTGRVLLESPSSLALSPNGHGGSLKALWNSGAIADMKKRGVEQVSYIQVDNPIVKVVDPLFLGLHTHEGCDMSSKMLPKAFPREKLGNFCFVDGKMTVIEYSDLPEELAEQRLGNGELRFRAGSIALHAIRVAFVESLNRSGQFGLPFHRAEKKVPHIDLATGERVEPTSPNAVKLETFVFDALPLTGKSIIYETDRVEEFAPIKNADAPAGQPAAIDSPASSKAIQTERAARWLEAHNVTVPRREDGSVDAVIEIAQSKAIEADDLRDVEIPAIIRAGERVLI